MENVLSNEKFVIQGGARLSGEVDIHGAKNSSLPLLAATILPKNQSILHNCPGLSDVSAACNILSYLGCDVTQNNSTVMVDTSNLKHFDVPENLMRQMRSSIVFLGAIIARIGKCRLSFPGGCELGPRPIDLHLSALRQLGVTIKEEHGFLDCYVENKLHGAKINLAFPSVGATENIILAAATAEGETIINNAAQEPEITDLANFLNKCGADINGAGKSTIVINGKSELFGAEHEVISDRIVAATFLCAGAITGGELLVKNVNPFHLDSITPLLEQTGCKLILGRNSIYIKSNPILKPIKSIRTMPYPGFPTDAQALLMAVTTISEGTSIFVENIFENRYKHAGELVRMGADIKVEGKVAVVTGVDRLFGAKVEATDLRGGAAMILASLIASGKTEIDSIYHIDRGYERVDQTLRKLGAKIRRVYPV